MKRIIVAVFLTLAILLANNQVFALSFSVDVPVQYTFSEDFLNGQKSVKPKDRSVMDTSGFLLSASTGWLGVGYENYEVNATGKFIPGTGPAGSSSIDFTMRFQIYDVFLDLPMPLFNTVVGYGLGQVSTGFEPVQGGNVHVDDADVSQYFIRVGIPMGKVFDLHLGYHVITAQDAKVPNGGGGPDKLHLSGSLLTAGIRAGW